MRCAPLSDTRIMHLARPPPSGGFFRLARERQRLIRHLIDDRKSVSELLQLPPWRPHVRFRRVQTLVREGQFVDQVAQFCLAPLLLALPPHRIARRVVRLEPRLRRPASTRFETMLSSPMRQTCSNTVGSSPVRRSTNLLAAWTAEQISEPSSRGLAGGDAAEIAHRRS
jgi:hypothetical protein